MRINGSGQSHDAAPLYWRSGRPMSRWAEAAHYLVINPLTLLVGITELARAIW